MKTYEELQAFIKEFTGVNPETPEQFKAAFNEKFFTQRDLTTKGSKAMEITSGYFLGKLSGTLKKSFSLETSEIEGKQIEEIIDLAAEKQKAAIEDLKKQATDPSEALKEIQAKLDKTTLKLEEEKNAKLELKKSLEQKDQEYATKEKNRKKTDEYNGIFEKLKKGEEGKRKPLIALSEEQELFLNNKIQSSFELDFEENGKVVLTDKEGKRIPNPNKAGEFLEPLEAFYQIAEERKYIQNNAGGKLEKDAFDFGRKPDQQQQNQQAQRTLPAKALENAERLKALEQK